MKIKIFVSLFISAAVMFLSQFLTVSFIGGNDGLGVTLLLFFVIYPVVSIVFGIISAKEFKKLWFIPVANGVFYLASVWTFLDLFEPAFILYAIVYIAIGLITSLISNAIAKSKAK